MIRFFMILTTLILMSFEAMASGPSYNEFQIEVQGSGTGKSEAKACNAAKEAITITTEPVDEYVQWTDCSPEDPSVVKSACSCIQADLSFSCDYTATITCVEEVWYP